MIRASIVEKRRGKAQAACAVMPPDAVRTLSCATAAVASRNPATVRTLAGIGRSPNVIANPAGEFNLDVQSGDDSFAAHKTGNAATVAAVAAGIRHVGV